MQMYQIKTTVNGRTVRKEEAATPMVRVFAMIAKDEKAGKITSAQAVSITADVVAYRRAGYPASLDTGTANRRYKIIKK